MAGQALLHRAQAEPDATSQGTCSAHSGALAPALQALELSPQVASNLAPAWSRNQRARHGFMVLIFVWPVPFIRRREGSMADRSDYLPSARLQDLAKAIDPKLKLELDAVQVTNNLSRHTRPHQRLQLR